MLALISIFSILLSIHSVTLGALILFDWTVTIDFDAKAANDDDACYYTSCKCVDSFAALLVDLSSLVDRAQNLDLFSVTVEIKTHGAPKCVLLLMCFGRNGKTIWCCCSCFQFACQILSFFFVPLNFFLWWNKRKQRRQLFLRVEYAFPFTWAP